MNHTIVCNTIQNLVDYAVKKGMAEESDRVYLINLLLGELKIADFTPDEPVANPLPPLESMLKTLCDSAVEAGLIPEDTVTLRDLFDTKLMGILTPRPSQVIAEFNARYAVSPQKATDYFYHLAKDSDYIRTYRVKKDLKWIYEGKYGALDITVNLSKPEKDPKAIAAAKLQKATGYPKCLLCRQNEGYAGGLTHPARQNIRLIPLRMNGEEWFLQYSPYVYYNEHCIALSGSHSPMKIDRSSFVKLLDFVTVFPHYFLGSNADLPIVGGSILSHDHMQGGRYTFAMERAKVEIPLSFREYPGVRAGIVYWPLSVIRLTGADKNKLIDLADRILLAWRNYSDPEAMIFAETDGEPHNTITPIARRRGEDYELDLVLRNNLTTPEHPLGLYHPHADKHNIKKENIGLIEVMGLAVLPARLSREMALLGDALAEGKDISADETLAKHAAWVEKFCKNYTFTKENAAEILRKEIGRTFEGVLEDAGVYPCTEEGRSAFLRFVKTI
ncbi:MAG: UDP-glucose--hexose-1-phosphate uridylyltransferase [Ruminococcaceae bacterium]|nr:UDP-glucose--hexose-1-phosphate uridylyltransferase [Oscillospiraceae bacterium]